MKPICVKCQCFYRNIKSGFYFTEGMPKSAGTKRGHFEPENWTPYKIWAGDKFRCPICQHEIIYGTGLQPINEYYKEDFEQQRKQLGADQYQVNDC